LLLHVTMECDIAMESMSNANPSCIAKFFFVNPQLLSYYVHLASSSRLQP
jgi:hypothetical protein